MASILQNIWWYLVLIGVMILIHELGHYWAARFFDVRWRRSASGLGRGCSDSSTGETDFRFSAILFGGYVKMAGEQPGDESATDPRSFLQAALAAADHRVCRSGDEHRAGGGGAHRAVHGAAYPKFRSRPSPVSVMWCPTARPPKPAFEEGDQIVQIDDTVESHLGRHRHEGSGQRRPSAERLGGAQWRAQAVHGDAGARCKDRRRIRGLGRAERNRGRQRARRIQPAAKAGLKPATFWSA